MERFEVKQRVVVSDPSRFARSAGQPAAEWLLGRLGVVQRLGREGGAFVMMDERLPEELRGQYPHDHPLGRNIHLLPRECQLAENRAYAPFHHTDFARALGDAAADVDRLFCGGEQAAWFSDITEQLRATSETGLWERVYRFGVDRNRVTLLIYSSVSYATGWSRSAGEDAVRFVHEVRWPRPIYHDTGSRVYRSGTSPLDRVRSRVVELLSPEAVDAIRQKTWTMDRKVRTKS